ncbi:hypothetical protein [Arthrobacter wenxiniae]|uniref:MFS transporter n=1 Tax=Arthrobacter wenxiniae TaxID=2713570 RepID=A0A7Y7IF17_9MICC|nr:hypothetical protein [Arthrobacter wenxiniae]NVM94296.1 MFS transporter [Arthrobacter wenxiniae]
MTTTNRPTTSDAAMRKLVVRKVSRRLLPFLGILYLINYLDRTNVAFAAPHGMNAALGLTVGTFGLASGLFFIGYLGSGQFRGRLWAEAFMAANKPSVSKRRWSGGSVTGSMALT